jgi:hypothetical protein
MFGSYIRRMSKRQAFGVSVAAGLVTTVFIGVLAGWAVGAGVFGMGYAPHSPLTPGPILWSGPSISSAPSRPRAKPKSNDREVPFWFPDYRDLGTISAIDALSDWIKRGDGQWNQLGRTLVATPAIAVLGLYSYLESTIRGLATPG